jgi:hypothetical protein
LDYKHQHALNIQQSTCTLGALYTTIFFLSKMVETLTFFTYVHF